MAKNNYTVPQTAFEKRPSSFIEGDRTSEYRQESDVVNIPLLPLSTNHARLKNMKTDGGSREKVSRRVLSFYSGPILDRTRFNFLRAPCSLPHTHRDRKMCPQNPLQTKEKRTARVIRKDRVINCG